MFSQKIAVAVAESVSALKALHHRRESQGISENDPLFTDSDIEGIYKIGYDLFQQKKYLKALPVFSTLSVLRNTDVRILTAEAICQKMLNHHEKALHIFLEVNRIQPENIKSKLHIVECLAALGNKDDALKILQETIDSATSKDSELVDLQKARQWLILMKEQ